MKGIKQYKSIELLKELIKRNGYSCAPRRTSRGGIHYETLVEIRDHHTAHIVVTDDAMKALGISLLPPIYNCHKQVHALKILSIETGCAGGTVVITPADRRYSAFEVDEEYIKKHNPVPGGYYVLYKDGYASFSPEDEFEEGSTLEASR